MNGLMNVHMDIQGDVACTETYLFAYHKICAKKAEGIFGSRDMAMLDHSRLDPANHHFYYGDRYIEHLERWLGEWWVATRTVVMDWNDNKQSGEILDQAMFATLEPRGTRGSADLAFVNRPWSVGRQADQTFLRNRGYQLARSLKYGSSCQRPRCARDGAVHDAKQPVVDPERRMKPDRVIETGRL